LPTPVVGLREHAARKTTKATNATLRKTVMVGARKRIGIITPGVAKFVLIFTARYLKPGFLDLVNSA
jgi:hypothetical protein